MSLPTPFIRFVPDADADANDVNANFDLITAKFAYGLADSDFSPTADLDGNKLSSSPAKQVPEAKLLTNAVSSRVLASHASVDASRAVNTDHLRDGCVTPAKLAASVATIIVSKAFSFSTAGGAYGGMLVTPDTAYAVGSYDVVGCMAKNVSNTGAVGLLSCSALPYSGGTNWAAMVVGNLSGGGSYTISGTLVLCLRDH
jgi:hypothetical protein